MMLGLNAGLGNYAFQGEDYAAKPTNELVLVETDETKTQTENVIKQLADYDVEVGNLNNGVLEVASMQDVFSTITGNPVIAQENIEYLETIMDGKYKPVADKIYEEVTPIAGFTKEPSTINLREVRKILGSSEEKVTKESIEQISGFVDERFEAYNKLVQFFETAILPSVLAQAEAIQQKAIHHLQSTSKNTKAFLLGIDREYSDEDRELKVYKILDLRVIPFGEACSLGTDDYPDFYPTESLFAAVNEVTNAKHLLAFMNKNQEGWNTSSVFVGEDSEFASVSKNIATIYYGVDQNNESVTRVSMNYLSLLGFLASGVLCQHYTALKSAITELHGALLEAKKLLKHDQEYKSTYGRFVRNLTMVHSRTAENLILADQVMAMISISNRLFDQFAIAEEAWKKTR